jgi:hypothetical protein
VNDCHDETLGEGLRRAGLILCAAVILAGIIVMAIGALPT